MTFEELQCQREEQILYNSSVSLDARILMILIEDYLPLRVDTISNCICEYNRDWRAGVMSFE